MDDRATLLQALTKGDVGVVQALVRAMDPADLNAADGSHGATLLHWACDSGHVEVVNVLLQSRADPDAPSRSGGTPLHWAAGLGSVEVCQALLHCQADPCSLDARQMTPLDIAKDRGYPELVDVLQSAVEAPWQPLHLVPLSLSSSPKLTGELPKAHSAGRGFLSVRQGARDRRLSNSGTIGHPMSLPDSLDSFVEQVHTENAHLKRQLSHMRLLQAELHSVATRPVEEQHRQEVESLHMQVKALEVRNEQLDRECQQLGPLRANVRALEQKNEQLTKEMNALQERLRALEALNKTLRADLQEAQKLLRKAHVLENLSPRARGAGKSEEQPPVAEKASPREPDQIYPPSTIIQEPAAAPHRDVSYCSHASGDFDVPYIHCTGSDAQLPERQFTSLTSDLESRSNSLHFDFALNGNSLSFLESPDGGKSTHAMSLRHQLQKEFGIMADVETRVQQFVTAAARHRRLLRCQRDGHRARVAILQGALERQKRHSEALQQTLWDAQERLKDAAAAGAREDALRSESLCLRAALTKLRKVAGTYKQEAKALQGVVQQLQQQLKDASCQPEHVALRVQHAALTDRCHELTAELQRLKDDVRWLQQAPRATPAALGSSFRHLSPLSEVASDQDLTGSPVIRSLLHISPTRSSSSFTKRGSALRRAASSDVEPNSCSHGAALDGLSPLQGIYVTLCQRQHASVNYALLASLPALPEDLRALDLGDNYVGRRGVMCVADLLSYCVNMTQLVLADNKLDNDTVVYLAGQLQRHPKLASVVLRNNGFSKTGGRALLQAVQVNTTLTEVVIENEPFLIPSLRARIEQQALLNREMKAFSTSC